MQYYFVILVKGVKFQICCRPSTIIDRLICLVWPGSCSEIMHFFEEDNLKV